MMLVIPVLTKAVPNGTQSPEVANTWLQVSERNFPVA